MDWRLRGGLTSLGSSLSSSRAVKAPDPVATLGFCHCLNRFRGVGNRIAQADSQRRSRAKDAGQLSADVPRLLPGPDRAFPARQGFSRAHTRPPLAGRLEREESRSNLRSGTARPTPLLVPRFQCDRFIAERDASVERLASICLTGEISMDSGTAATLDSSSEESLSDA